MDCKRKALKFYEPGCNTDTISMEKKFIRKYKQLPHLWNPNHPDYNNRMKRNAGYDALLPIFKEYMPKATRFHIRQKINILRSCYRKERRRYLASSTIDPAGNIIYPYMPSIWKYHALSFLHEDVENEVDGTDIETRPDYEDDQDQEVEYVDAIETESGNDEPDTSKIDISPIYLEEHIDDDYEDTKPFKRKRPRNTTHRSYKEFNSFSDDDVLEKEFNAIGSNVACKLQRMNLQQRYLAELLINKVLIKGLKESLTEETDLTNTWQTQVEVPINYNHININSNDDPKDDILNSTPNQSYEISEH